MSLSDKSLLPSNLNQLERDLAGALSRISDIDIPISTVWDPDNCPVDLLPFLAWALRVDHWETQWPESRKREVIKQSVDINRTRGTRGAVERAIKAIRGDDVKLIEWFEDKANMAKGTFRVDVKSTNEPIDITDLQKLVPSINSAKNTRSHLVGISVKSQVQTVVMNSIVSRTAICSKTGPWLVKSVSLSSKNMLVCLSRQAITVRSGPRPILLE
ncbi:phage tail protein I [Aliivibrio fischeri]|uniref:phage tail protein I n=1 Tax=Aliivibrio fischeri TaxID=668 RepID=UPI00080E26B7|nr:phage tail protein I [Aliivibrio fischeri]OCH60857.1 phage tail protein I [Aliivibrio fischeri]